MKILNRHDMTSVGAGTPQEFEAGLAIGAIFIYLCSLPTLASASASKQAYYKYFEKGKEIAAADYGVH